MSISSIFLRTNFLYESRFDSFFLRTHIHKKSSRNDVRIKTRVFNVDEIDARCQFHQCFTCKFFVQISLQSQNVTRKSCQNDFCMKNSRVKHWWNWLHGVRGVFVRKSVEHGHVLFEWPLIVVLTGTCLLWACRWWSWRPNWRPTRGARWRWWFRWPLLIRKEPDK